MTATFQPGDRIQCAHGGRLLDGTYITERDGMVVIKLGSGYNIGVPGDCCTFVERPRPTLPMSAAVAQEPTLPELSIVSTGGTIASRVDYRTGAVTSQFNAEDILRAIPGLAGIGRYRTRQVSTILSENMTPGIWQALARTIFEEVEKGVAGVIVTHGTDTMAYTAAAISFMVRAPVPIVFVGSQRSADRPSSDNAMNGLCSAAAAAGDLGEAVVVMHATGSDDCCAIHRATRVRKMHTSRRDAFQSIGIPPIGMVEYPSLQITLREEAVRRGAREPALRTDLAEKCGLLYFYPDMPVSVLECFEGYEGLVLAGTGLGHVSTRWIEPLKRLIDGGTTVMMTSQCLHGRVCDRVYDTGRDLLAIGVVEGEDMLPEAALVKLMWVLAREREPGAVQRFLQTSLVGEITRCSCDGL